MASDRSPPRKQPQQQQQHVKSTSPSHRMPTSGQTSRRGSADSSTAQGNATANESLSQPMTASATPSEAAGAEPPSTSATPAPYGTRSRGRNAPRPNYAEDRDIDMDLELLPPSAPKSSKKSSGTAATSTTNGVKPDGEKASSSSNSRRSLTAVSGPSAAAAKDAIPGTSSFSAKPDDSAGSSSSSRKRKQPASSTNSNSTNGNAAKKIFTAAPSADPNLPESSMVSFENTGAYLKDGKLIADDGTTFAVNDHVYLICEPPGEPYYLARIMEFLPSKDKPNGPIEALRVNWYYRPRDIHRIVADTRLVFASMHSDTCPLTSLRGKCQIKHLSEIDDFNAYRKTRDSFWYDKMFDRYIHRYYEVVPTKKVINVPANVKKVLDERWKFILVEIGKRKELFSAVKTCKRCGLYAASNDSVDCAVCHNTYHMYCVRPVLTKKPARGFAWACAACSRAQEKKLEARNTPIIGESPAEAEEEVAEEEEEEPNGLPNDTNVSTPAPAEEHPRPATKEQIAQARMWPYRYLGIHCRVEDALDYDDRIYPRASSRLGPRHQAIVNPWPGRPVEYAKPIDIKKKYLSRSGRKDSKLSKEAQAAIEAAKQEIANRPKWVMDEPVGYVRRGEDEPVLINGKPTRTAEVLFKMPTATQIPSRGEDDAPGAELSPADREKFIDEYMERAKEIAPQLGEEKYATNFLDKALELLYSNSFDAEAALAKLKQQNKYKDLKEPHLRPEEVKLFEQGVAKYGSELRNVTKHVGTVPHYQIVRFYYMWKKTPRGRQIWGGYEGRKGKKEAKRHNANSKLVDDVADDHDDSAFDNEKAAEKKRGFQCKFCSTRSSRQWRRAPGVPPGTTTPSEPSKKDKGPLLTVALCLRCALLWRKYGIQWESVDEVAKKIAQSGNKSWRRRVDEELLTQLLLSTETPISINSATAATAASIGVPVNANPQVQQQDSNKKKAKPNEKESTATPVATSVEPAPKKKPPPEKAPEPQPIVPDPPKAKTLPCAVCNRLEPLGDQHLSCRDCRLTVHRNCYGVSPSRNCAKWLCDMCSNDRSPMISTCYECVLCPVTWTEHELMEAPKVSHKKKTDRDREKERLEKEMVQEAIKLYRQRQEAVGKPIGPREPLKRTAGNNWVHVMCAVWTPEIKFGTAKELEPAEGFGLIAADRYRDVCKLCKTTKGACVTCSHSGCNARFHVGCAFQAQYTFGFNITPVKSSRRDTVSSIRLGEEVGAATAGIWCPHHAPSSGLHQIGEVTGEDGLNALQQFVQSYKQADLTLPGTVRRAAYVQQTVNASQHATTAGSRRASAINGVVTAAPQSATTTKDNQKLAATAPEQHTDEMEIDSGSRAPRQVSSPEVERKCCRCTTSFSPRWWPIDGSRRAAVLNSRGSSMNGVGMSSASPPFLSQNLSQHALPKLNGDYSSVAEGPLYECHKCYLKNATAQPSPEPRPSPYLAQRPVLPAPRIPEYHGHPYGPHAHPTPPPTNALPRPLSGPLAHGSEWYPAHEQRSTELADGKLRNGLPVPAYHGGPPPVQPHPLNGFQHPTPPTHHAPPPPPPHYPGGAPPPPHQPYTVHQSPYAPVSMPSPHPSHAPGPRPYASSASPPTAQATIVRHSPQHSLSALNGGPPPRMYSVDRILSAPTQSPPMSQARMDPRGLSPPGKMEDTSLSAAGGAMSTGRSSGVNGTHGGSGASASPSLKNLLS
ncbi:DNA-binding E3 ubiquitin-protein ligase SNT2 [Aspergillus fischeri NRRL 181]|uniref:PHD finger and BAH domain protein (Snt2), putative n=1 Tax=Neosartorya fischeri (strain ATCC 1020 / DSM 3700 / CBS 544.65 / FGSC A1164 / JCM 1740 / NRRL 181 / WB 181) TaxID=331117 RepID=A1D4A3_NEOFI|nr:PHD finger and BAH domain protein (Snt2), putative [Aspergillus fischeri NRRL 181]EAW23246.1 PHD finger and BAH domain protein (Snt2), putative [Aspergillus fischeri NRRL 181]KAG2027967.1 hypothetical protein GB937_000415 [Aspergillus fischeri]